MNQNEEGEIMKNNENLFYKKCAYLITYRGEYLVVYILSKNKCIYN